MPNSKYRTTLITRRLLGGTLLLSMSACSLITPATPVSTSATVSTTIKSANAIASAHPLATEAGLNILEQGGNAFDAAIAVAAVLGVVEPYSAGLGGGGFWLLHNQKTQQDHFIDARETAPLAAHRDLYLDQDGTVNRDKAVNTALAAGIPGQPAAFAYLAKHYGKLPLSTSLAPAIQYAEHGFTVSPYYIKRLARKQDTFARYPYSNEIFSHNGNIKAGDRLIQQDLAKTLKALASKGKLGFYAGDVANQLVNGIKAQGGIWSLKDLENYKVIERKPIKAQLQGSFGKAELISAPPPSSGGITLAQMLTMLEHLDSQHTNVQSTAKPPAINKNHQLIEVMRRAYRDRAEYLGDPGFVDIPTQKLLSREHNIALLKDYSSTQATPSATLKPAAPLQQGNNTTHLSVLDRWGNYVSATLSINTNFGSGVTVPGTGVLLNNEMDDFSAKPGSPNAYGLVGNAANAIAPGKRPLSSMTPSFVRIDNSGTQQVAILGTPGGSRIITMVMLGVLEALDGKTPEGWVARHRIHHQYLPDKVQLEPQALSKDERNALIKMGHTLDVKSRTYGNMQGILWNKTSGDVKAASDKRGIGAAAVAQ